MKAFETASAPAAWDTDRARAVIRDQKDLPGPLLPVLHALQATFGYVPDDAVPMVAEELGLSRADVHGVLSFYHFFRRTPPAEHEVWICRAEACQSMNSDALAERAIRRLGADFHGTSGDGRYSLEPVYCLGNCALAPAAMIDGHLYGRVGPERFEEIVSDLEESEG